MTLEDKIVKKREYKFIYQCYYFGTVEIPEEFDSEISDLLFASELASRLRLGCTILVFENCSDLSKKKCSFECSPFILI